MGRSKGLHSCHNPGRQVGEEKAAQAVGAARCQLAMNMGVPGRPHRGGPQQTARELGIYNITNIYKCGNNVFNRSLMLRELISGSLIAKLAFIAAPRKKTHISTMGGGVVKSPGTWPGFSVLAWWPPAGPTARKSLEEGPSCSIFSTGCTVSQHHSGCPHFIGEKMEGTEKTSLLAPLPVPPEDLVLCPGHWPAVCGPMLGEPGPGLGTHSDPDSCLTGKDHC